MDPPPRPTEPLSRVLNAQDVPPTTCLQNAAAFLSRVGLSESEERQPRDLERPERPMTSPAEPYSPI